MHQDAMMKASALNNLNTTWTRQTGPPSFFKQSGQLPSQTTKHQTDNIIVIDSELASYQKPDSSKAKAGLSNMSGSNQDLQGKADGCGSERFSGGNSSYSRRFKRSSNYYTRSTKPREALPNKKFINSALSDRIECP